MNSFLGILRANQDIVGTMIFGGVFDRHPELQVVCVEADAGWVPHWAYRADHAFDRHRNWLTASLRAAAERVPVRRTCRSPSRTTGRRSGSST